MELKSGRSLITKTILHAGTKSVTFTTGTKVGYCSSNPCQVNKIHKVGYRVVSRASCHSWKTVVGIVF